MEEEINKKDSKYRKVIETLQDMERGEIITPTKLFKEAHINPNNTGRDLLDFFESLKKISFEIIRDKNEKVIRILKTDEDLEFKKEIRDMNIRLLKIEGLLEELNSKKSIK